ncbi:MAG: PLP-dependent aminotransferase family protein [Bacteroidales bacterium]|nr:PLP-dependent aminotransferase family protein [Bacteroidales bacterium]
MDQLFSQDTHSFFRSPVREIFKRVDLNKIYSFAGGYPSADTFPLNDFSEIMQRVIREKGGQAFQYGATQGVTELRQAVADRYSVPIEKVQITSSSQQGIDVITRVLVDPGDVILTFNPSYLGALQSFCSYRADIQALSKDLNEWDAQVEALKAESKKIKFVYAIADFQNPSGETLTIEQRQALADLARKHGFLVLEDAPYRELRYEGEDLPTIYSLAPDVTVHLGSFSKIMAPGFRLGWMFGPEDVLDKVFVCKQSLDLCPPVFDQYVAAEFLSSGKLDANLKKSIELYRGKRDLMLGLLEKYMPEGVTWTHPKGGLFLFLTLPEGFDAVKFYDRALDAGVAYVSGSFFHTDGKGLNTMRLNFSFMTPEKIEAGIPLLAQLIREEL